MGLKESDTNECRTRAHTHTEELKVLKQLVDSSFKMLRVIGREIHDMVT